MLDKHCRKYVQPIGNFLGRSLIAVGLTPALITFLAFSSGLLSAVSIVYNRPLFALSFLWLSGLLDLLDGTVARLSKKTTPFGSYIDLISDRMVESALIIGFALVHPEYYLAYITFLVAVLFHFSTFVVAGALFKNTGPKSMHYDNSFIERAEAFIVFSLLILFPEQSFIVLQLFNILIFLSGIARFIRVARHAQVSFF